MTPHTPVMLDTCLHYLAPKPGRWYIDGTFGAGGHTVALLAHGVCVLAIDRDPNAAEHAEQIAGQDATRLRFTVGNFRNLDRLASEAGVADVAGVLLDLGVSSMQLDQGERGFAYRHDGPLDMRMDGSGTTAAEVVNRASGDEIAAILYRFGEERYSRRVARHIVAAREQSPITTTARLAAVVAAAYPRGSRRVHPARRTFQALRIHLNDELGALGDGLGAAERTLAPQGRLVVMSYHSLEDRIVKRHLSASRSFDVLTKRPIAATAPEIAANPRARSAKLRAALKVAA